MSHFSVTIEGNLARLVLSNPPQNRLAQEFFDELRDAISLIAGSGARAALLSAEGPDFSYGGDIVPWPTLSPEQLRAAFEKRLGTVNQWERLPVLTVAAVQGLCFGGGFELAIRSDIIFAGASARFGHPEQSLGIVTMLGGIQRVAERVGKAFAMEWALTSEQVPAQTMLERGVINRVVADESLLEEAAAFARKFRSVQSRPAAPDLQIQGPIAPRLIGGGRSRPDPRPCIYLDLSHWATCGTRMAKAAQDKNAAGQRPSY